MKLKAVNLFLFVFVFYFKVCTCDNDTEAETTDLGVTEVSQSQKETDVEVPSVTELIFPKSATKKPPKSSKPNNDTIVASKMSLHEMKIKELMAKLKKKAQERREQEAKRKAQKESGSKGETHKVSFIKPSLKPKPDPQELQREEEERKREEERLEKERLEQEKKERERLEQERREQEEREEEERKKNMKVRIVTEMMLLRAGVPVDYSYNETQEHPDQIVSSPGCPKSIDGYPWVKFEKHNETKCYLVGQIASACEGSSVMTYKKYSEYGVCACNFQECRSKYTKSEFKAFQKVRYGYSATSRYRFCRPINIQCEQFVFDKKQNQCFVLYTQGPCKENEWLQLDGKGGLECASRLCPYGKGLDDKSEKEHIIFRNLTKEAVSCCKSWGSYSVMNLMEKRSCKGGGEEFYSETLGKCLAPFPESGYIAGN